MSDIISTKNVPDVSEKQLKFIDKIKITTYSCSQVGCGLKNVQILICFPQTRFVKIVSDIT